MGAARRVPSACCSAIKTAKNTGPADQLRGAMWNSAKRMANLTGAMCASLIGVVTESPEVATSRAKSHVACSGLVSLIVEGKNILHKRKLRCAQSSAPEVKNECMERFACDSFYLHLLVLSASPSFYLLSCFYLLFLFLLLLLSFFSCHLRGPRFRVQTPFLSRGNNILHIFILHAEVTEMGITPSSQN